MAKHQISPNPVKSLVKRNPVPSAQMLSTTVTAFQPTFNIEIQHTYGDTPKVVMDQGDVRLNSSGIITVERTTDLVRVNFTELAAGEVSFNDTDSIITVYLSPRIQDHAHPQ